VLAYNQKVTLIWILFKRISLNDSPPHAAYMTQIELVVARLMDNRKRTAFLIYAQTLCTTPHNSDELYVELHTGLMHRKNLCPQPLLTPYNNNF